MHVLHNWTDPLPDPVRQFKKDAVLLKVYNPLPDPVGLVSALDMSGSFRIPVDKSFGFLWLLLAIL